MTQKVSIIILLLIILCFLIPSVVAGSVASLEKWQTAKDYMEQKQCSEALDYANQAIELDSTWAPPWNVKGSALACLGKSQGAIDAYDKAIAIDPSWEVPKDNKAAVISELAKKTTPSIGPTNISQVTIPRDGELKMDTAPPSGCQSLRLWGHTVHFTNHNKIVITGLRVEGCKYGDLHGNVRIEIWDNNLNLTYQDIIPYEKFPLYRLEGTQRCRDFTSWGDIDLPDHEVSGDFYIVIFTDSYAPNEGKHGICLSYETASGAGTSHTVLSNPNRFEEKNVGDGKYKQSEINWMIRVLYKDKPVSTMTVISTTTAPVTTATSQTKSPIEIPSIIMALGLSAVYLRREKSQ